MADKYTEYTNNDVAFQNVKLLGGGPAKVDVPSIVGYCHNAQHKGVLTVAIMNEHDCVAKECNYFEKFEDYPYWQRTQRREENNRIRKEKIKRKKENRKRKAVEIEERDEAFIEQANRFADELGITNFKIIGIRKEGRVYTIFYISDKWSNDWYEFREIAIAMNNKYQKKFILKHAKGLDGKYATI